MKRYLPVFLLFLAALGVAKCAGPQSIRISEYTIIDHAADGFVVNLHVKTQLKQVADGLIEQWEKGRPLRLIISSTADDLAMVSATIIWLKATGLTSGATFRSDAHIPELDLQNMSSLENSLFSQSFDLAEFAVEPIMVKLDVAVCFSNGKCKTVTVEGTLNFTTHSSFEFSWIKASRGI